MTTITPASTTATTVAPPTHLVRRGFAAAATAALATTAYAAVTHAAGVSYTIKGQAIPTLGFGEITLLFSLVGLALAAVLRRRARHPQSTLIRTTVALTALSFVPDITAHAAMGTRVSLMVSHVIAAAIVIPQLAAALRD